MLLQSLLFVDDHTFMGQHKIVYTLMKVLKTLTQSKIKSYEIKFALASMLGQMMADTDLWAMANPAHVQQNTDSLGSMIKLVMSHGTMRGMFDSVHPELEEMGITAIEVTEKGFRFCRSTGGRWGHT